MDEIEKLKNITHLILDVDGTLTDSGITYDENGNELKKFSTRDYAGVFAAHYIGVKVLIITGRKCAATERRAREMKIDELHQEVKNKRVFIADYMKKNNLKIASMQNSV